MFDWETRRLRHRVRDHSKIQEIFRHHGMDVEGDKISLRGFIKLSISQATDELLTMRYQKDIKTYCDTVRTGKHISLLQLPAMCEDIYGNVANKIPKVFKINTTGNIVRRFKPIAGAPGRQE